MAKELVENFKKELKEPMENLERAAEAFDDIDSLMEGPDGFDMSQVRAGGFDAGWCIAAARGELGGQDKPERGRVLLLLQPENACPRCS